ncbi:MAG: nucleotidyltransferase domain-containing protein, partial [Nitrospirales bacterium]|nr:nucleotidyltransferase domain-containing protein [Nitrospirales bacterium]
DVDILVDFERDADVGLFTFARLQRKLSQILGRPVDLVTPDAPHPVLKDRILEEAVRAA